MITVEELIIQSLYHKLVLVNVKRTPTRTPTGGTMDGLGVLITGAQRMRNAMARQGALPAAPEAGPDGEGTSEIDEDAVPIHQAASHSQQALSVSREPSLEVDSSLQEVLDTGEFKLVRMLSNQSSTESVMPPMWLLGQGEQGEGPTFRQTSLEALEAGTPTQNGEVMLKANGQVVQTESGAVQPAINLSSFEKFSIVHYQDKREPEKSLVMIQTPKRNNLQRVDELENAETAALDGAPEQEYITYPEKPMIESSANTSSSAAVRRQKYQLSRDESLEAQLFPDENGEAMISSANLEALRHEEAEMICMLPMSLPMDPSDMLPADHEMDSGIWDMLAGRDSQGSCPDSSANLSQQGALLNESAAGGTEGAALQEYVPDAEPVMSYRVYQINDEVVLNSEEDSRPVVETITERKALPISSSTPAVKKAQRKKIKNRGRRKQKSKARKASTKGRPVSHDGTFNSESSPTATGNSSTYDHTPDKTFEDHVAFTSHMLAISNRSHSNADLYEPERSPSRIETTFTVDNDVTYGSDDTAISTDSYSPSGQVVHKPLQRPLRSGITQGLNLVPRTDSGGARPKSYTGRNRIISKYSSVSQSDLSSPMSGEVLFSPTSDDSNCTMYTARSHASWTRATPTQAALTPGEGTGEPVAYRGPFMAVSGKRGSAYSDSSGDQSEYESLDDTFGPVETEMDHLFVNHANWMSELPKRLHSVPLSGLAIPGSNISLSIERDMRLDMNFSKCNLEMAEFMRKLPPLAVFDNFRHLMKGIWRSWMIKQVLTVAEQLDAGVRYFDLRLTKYRGAIYGENGLYSKQLRQYLKEMQAFLKDHAKEVIILNFQTFDCIDHKDKRALVTALFQVFGAKLCRVSKVFNLTLEEIWDKRKQVLAIFPDDDIEALRNHIFSGLIWSNKIVRCSQPKKQKAMDLVRYLDCIYDETRDEDMLHVTEAVLSPNMNMVFGNYKYKSMKELTLSETSPALKQWLLGKSDLNIVVLDFVGIMDLTGSVIALNELKKAETIV